MRGAAYGVLPGLEFGFGGGLGTHAAVVLLIGLPLLTGAVRGGRGGGLLAAAADAAAVVVVMMVVVVVVFSGAPISARPPVLSQVRVAALLRSAAVRLRVLEAAGEVHHEAGGSGAAGSAVRFPFGAVFPEGGCRREDGVFLEATRSGPHLSGPWASQTPKEGTTAKLRIEI